ncbi:Murein DD-endopeptidase MepS/murein LD-carboxypeptidase [Flavobacterium sp. 9R]|uniref:peptidoglycan endopeptidase n=1 Tax=Flavobacterium sp. 9R TaxID=2653143 RepID=UPI0012EF7D11|nr:peptidoglycan endopeptidase [Flavobacterium sp. 9R]VXA93033.1 Murein DD-endopeptidase MepS/murein LD-carboxypeptidase [Flavobacterium sp. 9R]
MKYFGILFWLLVCTTTTVFSQEKFITHKISQGETISSIAEKYNVSQKVIFNLNPKASGILKLNSVLKIPNKNYKKGVAKKELAAKKKLTKEIDYVVLPKETLFGIAKKFNVRVEEIKKNNPSIEKSGLQIGEKIKVIVPENFELKEEPAVAISNDSEQKNTTIPSNTTAISEFVAPNASTEGQQIHEVLASETKYGISKRYGISVEALEKLNPNIVSKSLEIGQKLNVPLQNKATEVIQTVEVSKPSEVKVDNPVAAANEQVTAETSVANTISSPETTAIVHEVLPKETKFGIAKKYGITVAELDKLNPSIHKKLRVGSILKIKEGTAAVAVNETETKVEAVVTEPTSEKFFGEYSIADDLIAKASDNLGIRYRSGGTTRAGFDCSGLMCSTFSALDIKLPRSSNEMSNIGIRVTPTEAKKGDLIFFKTRGSGRINHVGMVVEVVGDEIKFIHSSTNSGVIISSTKEGYYHRNFAQVNRVLK